MAPYTATRMKKFNVTAYPHKPSLLSLICLISILYSSSVTLAQAFLSSPQNSRPRRNSQSSKIFSGKPCQVLLASSVSDKIEGSKTATTTCTSGVDRNRLNLEELALSIIQQINSKAGDINGDDDDDDKGDETAKDILWNYIREEATNALGPEPEAGPFLYQSILAQPNLMEAVVTIISHELGTDFMPAPAIHNLFLECLRPFDKVAIHMDILAGAIRSPSLGSPLLTTLFHKGLHALVCYRVEHQLWKQNRKGLASYLQSTVSRKYSADVHPACQMGYGIHLAGNGVVIGETAVVGNDVSIFHGVTLGGTGKERGDRHPKVAEGVILENGSSVLGNIKVGQGSIVMARSIVTKEVPPLARVTGVPAKVLGYRSVLDPGEFATDLEHYLLKYLPKWKEIEVPDDVETPPAAPKKAPEEKMTTKRPARDGSFSGAI